MKWVYKHMVVSFMKIDDKKDWKCNRELVEEKLSVGWISFFPSLRSIRWYMFFKIGVLKTFVIFTGKHLCWGLFFNKVKYHLERFKHIHKPKVFQVKKKFYESVNEFYSNFISSDCFFVYNFLHFLFLLFM